MKLNFLRQLFPRLVSLFVFAVLLNTNCCFAQDKLTRKERRLDRKIKRNFTKRYRDSIVIAEYSKAENKLILSFKSSIPDSVKELHRIIDSFKLATKTNGNPGADDATKGIKSTQVFPNDFFYKVYEDQLRYNKEYINLLREDRDKNDFNFKKLLDRPVNISVAQPQTAIRETSQVIISASPLFDSLLTHIGNGKGYQGLPDTIRNIIKNIDNGHAVHEKLLTDSLRQMIHVAERRKVAINFFLIPALLLLLILLGCAGYFWFIFFYKYIEKETFICRIIDRQTNFVIAQTLIDEGQQFVQLRKFDSLPLKGKIDVELGSLFKVVISTYKGRKQFLYGNASDHYHEIFQKIEDENIAAFEREQENEIGKRPDSDNI